MKHHLESTKKQFIGRTLVDITRLDDDKVMIILEDSPGRLLKTHCRLSVYGDCCSSSIFYEIVMPGNIKGGIIEDLWEGKNEKYEKYSIMPADVDSEEAALAKIKKYGFKFSGDDQNSIWNVTFKTNKGNAFIRHINSSNGYYDGDSVYEWQ